MHNDSGLIHYTDEVQLTRAHKHTQSELFCSGPMLIATYATLHASEHLKPDARENKSLYSSRSKCSTLLRLKRKSGDL